MVIHMIIMNAVKVSIVQEARVTLVMNFLVTTARGVNMLMLQMGRANLFHKPMVITVGPMDVVKVSIDQVIHMILMGDGLMTTRG